MKKKIYIVAMILALSATLCGCGKKEEKEDTASVRDDVIEFVNQELPAIEADRNSAIAVYNSYFVSDDVDLDLFVSNMNSSAIPSMETYISNLTAIEVATDEVVILKNMCLQCAQKQHDAMKKVVLAIEEQNPDYLSEAEGLISEAETTMAEYQEELKAIAADNNITISGSVTD